MELSEKRSEKLLTISTNPGLKMEKSNLALQSNLRLISSTHTKGHDDNRNKKPVAGPGIEWNAGTTSRRLDLKSTFPLTSKMSQSLQPSGALRQNLLLPKTAKQTGPHRSTLPEGLSYTFSSSTSTKLSLKGSLESNLALKGTHAGLSLKSKYTSPLIGLSSTSVKPVEKSKTAQAVDQEQHKSRKELGHAFQLKQVKETINEQLVTDFQAPHYKFQLPDDAVRTAEVPRFPLPRADSSSTNTQEDFVHTLKFNFINAVSSSLIGAPDFTNPESWASLKGMVEELSTIDPEFILKVALYARRDLNIRTTANFLLALSSFLTNCRIFLKKYFVLSINLPSDWIEVAEYYQLLNDKTIKSRSLPAALRRMMVKKFKDFDKYQLAKYNKQSSSTTKKKMAAKARDVLQQVRTRGGRGRGFPRGRGSRGRYTRVKRTSPGDQIDVTSDEDSDFEDGTPLSATEMRKKELLDRKRFTLKQLIRKLHITEPVDHVMCLIGKKYPSTLEEFYKSRLPGTWEEEKAGKRMKLPTPETWETQVSLKGNKAATWEALLDRKKLPFMAMLRNLRNMIISGMSKRHHGFVIKKLSDEGAVINSKQFPFRFFSAYEVLKKLEEEYVANQEQLIKQAEASASGVKTSVPKPRAKGRAPTWQERRARKMRALAKKEVPYDTNLLNRYRKALDTAVKIATVHNVTPIKGSTLIFCHLGLSIPCTAAKGLGTPRTVSEIGALLGLMCKYVCEECTMVAYGNKKEGNTHIVELEKGTVLDNMQTVLNLTDLICTNDRLSHSAVPSDILLDILLDKKQIDNLIVLSAGHIGTYVDHFLEKYRRLVNPDLLFVNVLLAPPLGASRQSTCVLPSGKHPNDINIAGYSDQILRFIAERGRGGQLTHVEKIGEIYNIPTESNAGIRRARPELPHLEPEALRPITVLHPMWRTARVFISSTFKDMHGERDLLTRFVFPELRAKAKEKFIDVVEVDLRWGVTEEDTKHDRTLQLCLSEVEKCNFFVGLLGKRYGWALDNYSVPDVTGYEWLESHPAGCSLTELEVYHAALRPNACCEQETTFFYLRDHDKLEIPEAWKTAFVETKKENKKKLDHLVDQIKKSGCEVYDGYPCHWGGVVEGKPVVAGLEDFGARVLNNLWQAISNYFPDQSDILDELAHETVLHRAYLDSRQSTFTGRKGLLTKLEDMIIDSVSSGLIVMHGNAGSGKTALLAYLFGTSLPDTKYIMVPHHEILHFIGASPSSTHIIPILKRFCEDLNRRFNLRMGIPDDYKNLVVRFRELLSEAGQYIGGSIIILLDGVDLLDDAHQAKSFEWIPDPIPENVIFIVSCQTDGPCHKVLSRHTDVNQVNVTPLEMLEKAGFVRNHLERHRKVLDESPFNNQMKLLTAKKDASLPLYLTIACEELRVFGVFEKVTEKLKSIPPTLPKLIQVVIDRLESDNGPELVQAALCLLFCASNGLLEHELHSVLSLTQVIGKKKVATQDVADTFLRPGDGIPASVFTRLLRELQSFISTTQTENYIHLRLYRGEIGKAIQQRYMKSLTHEQEIKLHTILAGFFYQNADPDLDGTYNGHSVQAFMGLPYHLTCAGDFTELETVLCNLEFIEKKCQLGLAFELLEDFQVRGPVGKAAEKQRTAFMQMARVQQYHSFISRNVHILSKYPTLTVQQALNEPDESDVAEDAAWLPRFYEIFRWVNKPANLDSCHLTISDLSKVATSIRVCSEVHLLACGTDDGVVYLYDLDTGKRQKSFTGHAGRINGLCFVGKTRLCSASDDSTLSLWDVEGGFRVAILKGHKRSVASCAVSPDGKIIVSASLDNSARLWKAEDGKIVSDYIKDWCPLNCVAFHPNRELVVTGSWDATVKVWDPYSKTNTRKAVFRGHTSSVRDVVFSPTGQYIASASMGGEVCLWSASSSTQIAKICGHALPINRIAYSPSGLELVTVSNDTTVKVWSSHLGRLVSTLGEERFGPAVCVSLSPDGNSVAVGYHEGHTRVFSTSSGVLKHQYHHHSASVKCIKFNNSGKLVFTGSDDCTIARVDLESETTHRFRPHTAGVWCLALGGKFLVSGSEDCSISVFRTEDLRRSKPIVTFADHTGPVTGCCFNPDATLFASCSRDMSVIIWDVVAKCSKKILHACHSDWINDCSWSNTGDYLVTCSNDFTLKMWDVKTGKEKRQFIGHTASVNSVTYNYGCIVSTCYDGTVKVWSHKGFEISTLHGHSQRVNGCDMIVQVKEKEKATPKYKDWASMVLQEDLDTEHEKAKLEKNVFQVEDALIASGSDDGTVLIWRPREANELACLVGHSDKVISVDHASDGRICTTSLDKTVKEWIPNTKDATSWIGHDTEISCLEFSEGGEHMITGSWDGTVKLWSYLMDEESSPSIPKCRFNLKGHAKAVSGACFSQRYSNKFVTCSLDSHVIVWSLKTDDLNDVIVEKLYGIETQTPLTCIKWYHSARTDSSKEPVVICGDILGNVICVNLKRKSVVPMETGCDDTIWDIGFDKRKNKMFVCGADQDLSIMCASTEEGELKFHVQNERTDYDEDGGDRGSNLWLLVMSVQGSEVVIGDSDGQLSVYSVDEGHMVETTKVHSAPVTGVIAQDDLVFTSSEDKTVKVWRREHGRLNQIGLFQLEHPITHLRKKPTPQLEKEQECHLCLICGDKVGNLIILEWKA